MAIALMPVGTAKGIAGEMEIVPRHATFAVKEIARTVTGIALRVRVTDLDFKGDETALRPLETYAARETAEEIAPTFVALRMIVREATGDARRRAKVTDHDFKGNETVPRHPLTFVARETEKEVAPTLAVPRKIAEEATEADAPMVVATNALDRNSNNAMP